MKLTEIRNLEMSELNRKLVDFRGELVNLRFQRSLGQLQNVRRAS
ncbi:MAG: 50S ribosomal protein L29, partial [Deltaproteobacteria bacterium]|nr:50S ribosomal protein L29 [Deltaproteobacteria bacterium]